MMLQFARCVVLLLLGIILVLSSGCGWRKAPPARPGEPAALDGRASVRFAGVSDRPRPDTGPATDGSVVWLVFDVTNTSETSLTLPGRPVTPRILRADGKTVRVRSSAAHLTDGGGGFDPASSRLGAPYLNPGGTMHALFGVRATAIKGSGARPLTITYAPTEGRDLRFIVP